ncbi:MAG: hypothetical protein HY080_06840 [Gammaproteobacteria bacterium]|nr:hypothetical protein [Gammaproteobacteria bacterium]
MYRRYPYWLRLFLICLLFGVGQIVYSAVPAFMNDCYHHCADSSLSTDSMNGMSHTTNGSCCDNMQACGHCNLSLFLPAQIELSFVWSSQAVVSDFPTDLLGFIPPLHEHPPRG